MKVATLVTKAYGLLLWRSTLRAVDAPCTGVLFIAMDIHMYFWFQRVKMPFPEATTLAESLLLLAWVYLCAPACKSLILLQILPDKSESKLDNQTIIELPSLISVLRVRYQSQNTPAADTFMELLLLLVWIYFCSLA